jgi:hypothetical protein
MGRRLAAVLSLLLAGPVLGQEARRQVTLPRTAQHITVDGDLGEPA